MTTSAPERTTIDQVVQLARTLSPRDQVRVVELLAAQIAQTLPADPPALPRMTADEARAARADLRATFSALPGPRLSLGEQLDADRRDRDRALLGDGHVDDACS